MSQSNLRRHQRSGAPSQVVSATALFEQIISVPNLVAGHHDLAAHAGQGRDEYGYTYSDYSLRDVWRNYRELVQSITSENYEPGPCRPAPIPKRPKPGQTREQAGTRTLQLPTIPDRTLSYVLHRALTPLIDADFADRSYGFRQGKNLWHLLLQIERDIRRSDSFFLVQDDVRNAFPSVDIELLLTLLNCYPFSQDLLALIARVLRSELASDHPGLRQGDSFSPTTLNVVLNHIHDRWLNSWQQPPLWFRYADNLVYLAQNELEAQEIRNRVQTRLNEFNLALKGEDGPPVDLRRKSVTLLGFSLRWKNNNLVLSLRDNAWAELEHLLDNCLENRENGEFRLRGWISANAPALYRLPGDNHLRRLKNLYEARFNPVSLTQLHGWVAAGGRKWKEFRRGFGRGVPGVVSYAPHTPFFAASASQGCPESRIPDACPF